MKAKILIDDPANRFKSGEIGELIDHDFEKYDYCVDLGTMDDNFEYRRIYYFYKDEIERIYDKQSEK